MNPDLWARLLDLLSNHHMTMAWVRGHAGNHENERADELAVAALKNPDLEIDAAYERG